MILVIPALSIHHSFTLSLQAQNLPFQQIPPMHLNRLLLPIGLPSWTGLIMLVSLFLVSHFNFWFSCPVGFLLHVKYTPSYRIYSLH